MSHPNLNQLLGRRIVGVILKEGKCPSDQLFLIFDDGTYAEVWATDGMNVSTGWRGDAATARAYLSSSHRVTQEAHLDQTSSEPST
jgi:hypothetical protein